jgi:hypothetical protein
MQCDSTRPSCQRCEKYGVECPGYPQKRKLVFRNDTLAVRDRAQRKYDKRKLLDRDSGQLVTMRYKVSRESPASRIDSDTARIASSVPLSGGITAQLGGIAFVQGAVAVFLSQWSNKNVDIFWGLFDPLVKDPESSLRHHGLGCAINSVALMALALRPEMETINLRKLALSMYGRSLQSIHQAIQDSVGTLNDENLFTVSLTALFEKMNNYWDLPTPPASVHLRGLISMINARGPQQFRNPLAMKMLLYVYFNWTTTAMPELAVSPHLGHTWLPPLSDDIWRTLRTHDTRFNYPAFRLMKIVQKSMELRASSYAAVRTAKSDIPAVYKILEEVVTIDRELWNWQKSLLPTDPKWGQGDRLYQMLITSWYRTHRIFLADLAIICHQRLAELEKQNHDLAIWEHVDVAQNAVAEICGRIPYRIGGLRKQESHLQPRIIPEARITYLYHASLEYPLLVCSMVWTLPEARKRGIEEARQKCARYCGLKRPWSTYPEVLIYLPTDQRAKWIRRKEAFGERLGAADAERRAAAERWVKSRAQSTET